MVQNSDIERQGGSNPAFGHPEGSEWYMIQALYDNEIGRMAARLPEFCAKPNREDSGCMHWEGGRRRKKIRVKH